MSALSCKSVKPSQRQFTRPRTGRNLEPYENKKVASTFQISIFGFDKLQNPTNSICKRVVWFVATSICLVVCFFQLYDRVSLYLRYPTAVQVTVDRLCHVEFPVFTLCPSKSPFDVNATVKLYEAINSAEFCLRQPQKCTIGANVPFKNLNLTLDEIWAEFSITEDDVLAWSECSSQEVKTNRCLLDRNSTQQQFRKQQIDTVLGRCLMISMEEAVLYRGKNTFLEIQVLHRQYHAELYQVMITAEFYFQPKGSLSKVCGISMRYQLPMSKMTVVQVQRKEFQTLDLPHNPCVDEETFNKCVENCFDTNLAKRLNCSLPFVNSSELKPCTNYRDAAEAYQVAVKFYHNENPYSCSCVPQCNETVYSSRITVTRNATDDNHTVLWVDFADDWIERAVEVATYGSGDLLSDIGGSFGFFLGICVLHILEIFDELFKKGVEFARNFSFKGRRNDQPVAFTCKGSLSSKSLRNPLLVATTNDTQFYSATTNRLVNVKRHSMPNM